jgi:drug/metabolite transporter (DMT)-like permease
VPAAINPIVSVIGMYVAVLVISIFLLPLFPSDGGLWAHFKQLNWIQIALAIAVLMIELGFLLMYRAGWNLSTGNVVTGVFVNTILVGIGIIVLKETVSFINIIGIILSIIGVALISIRS